MKNLKKALVLVLAFAMVFSLFTFNASAASFADDEDIVNKEAVSTMSQLGVINGYEDGTFLPNQIVTRAEMCKMICVALNGGKAPLLGSTAPVFSDTAGHWANDYINYCYTAGIVSGDAGKGGPFRPDATVTGIEAAKMMLVALGYNSAVAGFTGADWANNVAMAANKKGLFEGIGAVNASAGLTRDNAAQLIFNGINATVVEYSNVLDTVDGKLVSRPVVKDKVPAETILSTMFKVQTSYGQLTSVNKGALTINKDSNYDSKATGTLASFTKVANDYSALLGQTVKVMYKSATEVLGVTPLDVNSVVTANVSAVTNSSGKAKIGSATYTLDTGFTLITITADGNVTTNASATVSNFADANSFDTVKLIDNDGDGKYEYGVRTGVAAAKVTYVSNSEIVAGTSYKYADNNIADDIAKNDYVAITHNVFTGKKDIVKIEKGTSAVSIGTNNKYMFNGTWYNKGNVTIATTEAGKIYDYYVLNGVVVYAKVSSEDTSTSTANLAMVLVNPGGSPLVKEVRILNLDGTKEIVTVADDSTVAYASLAEGDVYSITRTDKGVKFSSPAGTIGTYTQITTPTFNNDGGAVTSATAIAAVDNVPIDDAAKIFIYNGTAKDGRVITGKQFKSQFKYQDTPANNKEVATDLTIAYKSTVNGLNRTTIAAAVLGGTTVPPVSAADKNYAMIVSTGFQLDSTYAQYTIWDGSSTQVVKEKISDITSTPRPQFTVITYGSIDANGEIKEVNVPTFGTADTAGNLVAYPIASVSSNKMWIDDNTSYNLTAKTVYMYFDSSATAADKIGIAGGELVRADKVSGVAVPNVKYITDGTDVLFVLVDIKNQLTDALTRSKYTANTATNAPSVTADTGTIAVSFSRNVEVLPGEIITMTVKIPAGSALNIGLKLTNAKFASNDTDVIDLVQAVDTVERTYTFSIVCTGGGAISVAKR